MWLLTTVAAALSLTAYENEQLSDFNQLVDARIEVYPYGGYYSSPPYCPPYYYGPGYYGRRFSFRFYFGPGFPGYYGPGYYADPRCYQYYSPRYRYYRYKDRRYRRR